MRIAMIGTRGIPAGTGGAERVVEALAGELAARGHEVLVYSRRHYVCGKGTPSAGTQVITRGLRGKHTEALTHTLTAMLDVCRRDVDVVHVHSPGPAVWNWLARLAGKPTVLTVHAPDWRRDKWSAPARLALRAGLWVGMKTAQAVTAVSQPLAEELAARFGRAVAYVPNAPSPVGENDPAAVTEMGLLPDAYGLYVGRIVPEKRLDLLLGAWQKLGASETLAVVGQVPDDTYGRRCRDLGGPNVRWLGSRYGRDLSSLYASASVVLQPSVLEGMSLVLLEAAACGRCIVAADIPENRAAMGEAILYHGVDDLRDLCDVIGQCLADSDLRHRMGHQAMQHVRQRYSWAAAAEQMETIYRRCTTAGRGEVGP